MKLKFGDEESIRIARKAEDEGIILEFLQKESEFLKTDIWKGHDYECDDCGSSVVHDGEPDIKASIVGNEIEVVMRCQDSFGCDEQIVKMFPLPEKQEQQKDLDGQIVADALIS